MGPYVVRRLIIMIPVFFAVSLVAFLVIELPPGDFVSYRIAQLRAQGENVSQDAIASLVQRYGLDQPWHVRYLSWIGGFVRGDMGISLQYNQPVTDLIGERIGYTVLIAFLTLLFSTAIAIPIGILSAVRQYSLADYVFTVLGFLGLAVPSFLLALVIMYVSYKYFGHSISGLFATEFVGEPWSRAKFASVLGNIWVPIVVVGVAGTAATIRVLRAQMLDELGKQYLRTARAKGLRERTVVLKHMLRVAINPILSSVGGILPELFSGAVIVGIVLGLPTTGPLMLQALKFQDMYLAGSILMIETVLVLIGTLVSDILLAVADPRIRYD